MADLPDLASLPLQLISLADTWRARGDTQCADELEQVVNSEPNRAGVWVSLDSLEQHNPHEIPEHPYREYGKQIP